MNSRRLPARRKQDWGQLGPAMKALPNDQWRAFAEHYVTEKPGHGALAAAARKAGFRQEVDAGQPGEDRVAHLAVTTG